MTAIDEVHDVHVVVEDEIDRAAVQEWLDSLGMTLDELSSEAARDDFRSDDAAVAWFTIRNLFGEPVA